MQAVTGAEVAAEALLTFWSRGAYRFWAQPLQQHLVGQRPSTLLQISLAIFKRVGVRVRESTTILRPKRQRGYRPRQPYDGSK